MADDTSGKPRIKPRSGVFFIKHTAFVVLVMEDYIFVRSKHLGYADNRRRCH
ncbi:hypothetical protein IQ22_03157 [Pseudomonas duriflava]|uniref:Uncharacterized protein n=1 Tax=Pseudomonas duriflava TaxID=459528 RepID=A0A562Q7P3_9PSED|nr:hypothetical protein IQ22_03157 [Pseudomonas duriflava]